MVSLIILPVNSFSVPFLGSLAFVCSLPSLPFDLGKGLWPKGGFPLSLSRKVAERSPHLLSEWLSKAPGFLLSRPYYPHRPLHFPHPVLQPSLGFLAPTGVITPH